MEAASERRDPHATRVPLDDVLVDLYPEGHDESFPADAIDVGLGGLAMRSAVLPDVGSRLRCRFRAPGDGGSVAADAEVVWAEDSGPNLGQFGLRFTELAESDAERIAGLVDAWHDSLGALSIANDVDSIATDARVSLKIDGVGPAVETELVHSDASAMIVEQPLPFLTIGRGVESEGRRGVLEAVDLRMEGDVPRLTLTVLFQEVGGTLAEPTAPLVETLDESDAPVAEAGPVVAREIDARAGVPVAKPPSMHEPEDEPEDELEDRVDPSMVGEASSAELDAVAASSDESPSEADPLLAELRTDPRQIARQALRRVLPLWVRTRAWLLVAWAKVGPWVRIAGARARGFFARCWTTVHSLRSKSGGKRTQRRPQQPQRQTRAPRRQARPGERASSAPSSQEPARRRRRTIARLGLLALVFGLGALLTQLVFADDLGAATKLVLEKPVAPEPEPAPAIDPEVGDDSSLAQAEAEPQGGPLDAPSFPAMPTASSSQPLAFGEARVPGGREFRLRLSVPPTALRGEPTSDGFTVTLDGSNAVDGARRIGATHPRVARASILNEGERAVLTIRFAEGANPAYRVEARGEALLITIGR